MKKILLVVISLISISCFASSLQAQDNQDYIITVDSGSNFKTCTI